MNPSQSIAVEALCLLALSFCAPALAGPKAAASDTMADYSHTLPLTVSGRNAVVQLRLPREVYLNARSADLHDLRVFDARGARLPFAVIAPPAQSQTSHRELPVKVFPVLGHDGRGADVDAGMDIRTSPDGSLLSVSARAGPARAGDARDLAALVLDLRQRRTGGNDADPAMVDALNFTLPAGTANYSARVSLETSDNLKEWTTVGYSSLSWLANGDAETLSNNRIDFPARPVRYARITWDEGKPLQFARIVAESPIHTYLAPPLENATLKPVAGRFGQDLVYQSSVAIPVQTVALAFAEANIVMPAQLGQYVEVPSRRGATATSWEFSPRLRATFFRIAQGGTDRNSGQIAVNGVHAAQWVLRPQAPTASKPDLMLTWTPATLVFMGNGNDPYMLGFGRDKAEPARLDVEQVAPGFTDAELVALEHAVAGPVLRRAGAPGAPSDALAAGTAARGRMATLWGVLLLGVAVLAYMAWRLFQQMQQQGKK